MGQPNKRRKLMGGNKDGGFFDFCPSLEGGSRTVVLMGRTGDGKSATGNSILGKKVFESRASMSSITSTSECLTKTFSDGVVNVIDTPGLFDSSVDHEFVIKEIMKCIDLAKDGIHAILLVLSVRARFTEEETTAIEGLQEIFGPKITDYIIVVFTGGDILNDQSLEDFLSRRCPDPLQKVLDVCKNRTVLFDNNTEDKWKKAKQLQKLFRLVDKVIKENDGKPYTNLLFSEMKQVGEQYRQEKDELNSANGRTEQEMTMLMKNLQISYERMMGMVLGSLFETNLKLQKQLAEEEVARQNTDKKSGDEINELRQRVAKAEKSCSIL